MHPAGCHPDQHIAGAHGLQRMTGNDGARNRGHHQVEDRHAALGVGKGVAVRVHDLAAKVQDIADTQINGN